MAVGMASGRTGRRRSRRGGRGPMAEINVTPLVDVMLVLLIIFMVSAPMMTTGIEVDLPKTHAAQMDVEEQKLLLTITKEQAGEGVEIILGILGRHQW